MAKLEKLRVTVPIHRHQPVDDSIREIAQQAADKMSATPVKDLKFVRREPSAIAPYDNVLFEGHGTMPESTEG